MQRCCFERLGWARCFIGLAVCAAFLSCGGAIWFGAVLARPAPYPAGRYPVGMTQIEYVDPAEGGRHLAIALFYPAIPPEMDHRPAAVRPARSSWRDG